MILNLFVTLLSLLGLIFAPFEAGSSLLDNNSSKLENSPYAQGSAALSGLSSAVAPRPLADAVIPDTAHLAFDFDMFEADRGVWVGADGFESATVVFTVKEHIILDENGEEFSTRDSNHATIRVTSGCTDLKTSGFYALSALIQTTRMIAVNDCESRNYPDEVKVRMLFDSKPEIYFEGDTIWIASQTQVARFDRVEEAN